MDDEPIKDDELDVGVPLDDDLDLKKTPPLLDDEVESIHELEDEEALVDKEDLMDDVEEM